MSDTNTLVSKYIAMWNGTDPARRRALVAGPDAHHDRIRFSWSLSPNGGAPIAIGVDFATVAQDGRMRSVTGFLEPAA